MDKHRQAKYAVQTKQHRGCYDDARPSRHGRVDRCVYNTALKGGYRYSHSRLQVDIVDCR